MVVVGVVMGAMVMYHLVTIAGHGGGVPLGGRGLGNYGFNTYRVSESNLGSITSYSRCFMRLILTT